MAEFFSDLVEEQIEKPIDPLQIWKGLDKKSGKEFLRPVQEKVLKDWFATHRENTELIIKLHTGQGKTLIGLLILQASLNEGKGPAIYLCPNNFLVSQIIEQANFFGIKTVSIEEGKTQLPLSFRNSEAILVTNCKKLFNGKSVFGVSGSERENIFKIGSIVMDDAHKCLDIIKESFTVNIKKFKNNKPDPLYEELFSLFYNSLKRQGAGTLNDIMEGDNTFLAVPFWSWYKNEEKVLQILSKYKDSHLIFTWELIKDHLGSCTCVISGRHIEIMPRLLPLQLLPSFTKAERKIFLSVTLTEDAFLVRDLGIDPRSVENPLVHEEQNYSGGTLNLNACLNIS